MARSRSKQLGVSLIEALVALLVMAFGMLAIVGVQATLRLNSDIAKQRSEAVRIAQEAIEDWRSFTRIAATADNLVPPVTDYTDIATSGATAIAGYTTNTAYTVERGVTTAVDPRLKTLRVTVRWADRTSDTANQWVELNTTIAGISPELSGTLSLAANGLPTKQVRGRNPVIPVDAVSMPGGTSAFTPPQPGGGTVVWVFDDTTGFITSICTTIDPSSCVTTNARLLRGFVRFALPMTEPTTEQPTPIPTQPTSAQAEAPPSTALAVQVSVNRTLPTPTADIACYQALTTSYVAYYCAVPVTSDASPRWSGQSLVSGIDMVTSLADSRADRFRVCRYTPARNCHPAVGSTLWDRPNEPASCTEPSPQTDPPKLPRLMRNADHPLDYANATESLTNQNFLVIRGGNGSTAFECPSDDESTPLVDGNTWRHQPAS
jgi:Tfp pilus assembly protein PilV